MARGSQQEDWPWPSQHGANRDFGEAELRHPEPSASAQAAVEVQSGGTYSGIATSTSFPRAKCGWTAAPHPCRWRSDAKLLQGTQKLAQWKTHSTICWDLRYFYHKLQSSPFCLRLEREKLSQITGGKKNAHHSLCINYLCSVFMFCFVF